MQKGYKHLFIDLETTGLDEKIHHPWQISGVITDSDLVELESFDFIFTPTSLEHIDDDSLEKCRTNVEALKLHKMSSADAYQALLDVMSKHVSRYDKTDKFITVAYNAEFDKKFLRAFFDSHNDSYFGSWFWHPFICAMQVAAYFTSNVRGSIPNFKLGTLCQCAGLGWDESRAHDGLYDVRQTMKLYKYLREYTPTL